MREHTKKYTDVEKKKRKEDEENKRAMNGSFGQEIRELHDLHGNYAY